jgi:hypothetical protein
MDQDVAGVGVSVKEPVHQYLIQVGSEQLDRQLTTIELQTAEWSERTGVAALDPVHGQYQRGRVVRDRLRDDDAVVSRQVVVEHREIPRLGAVSSSASNARRNSTAIGANP